MLVALTTDLTSRLDAGSVLFTDRGTLTVVQARVHHDRWIVEFEEIGGRDEAERWRGTVLRSQALDAADLDEPDALWVHQLIGATVQLEDGTHVGAVESVQANPASDLLVLDTGPLVPVVFVTHHTAETVTIDPPEGLLDL